MKLDLQKSLTLHRFWRDRNNRVCLIRGDSIYYGTVGTESEDRKAHLKKVS